MGRHPNLYSRLRYDFCQERVFTNLRVGNNGTIRTIRWWRARLDGRKEGTPDDRANPDKVEGKAVLRSRFRLEQGQMFGERSKRPEN